MDHGNSFLFFFFFGYLKERDPDLSANRMDGGFLFPPS
jgi:hypothetical protein